jgi:hypothetical protein
MSGTMSGGMKVPLNLDVNVTPQLNNQPNVSNPSVAPIDMQNTYKPNMKKGGVVKKMAKGGVTRGDGCATRGKTKGRMV